MEVSGIMMGNSEETPFTIVHETEPEIPEMKVTIEEQSVVAMCSMMKRSHSDIHMERRIHQVCSTDKSAYNLPLYLVDGRNSPCTILHLIANGPDAYRIIILYGVPFSEVI